MWGQASGITRPVCPQDIGKNIYTIREVVREIRDKATRRRLAVLPYELRFKEPFPEYVRLGECPGAALAGTPSPSGDSPALVPVNIGFRDSHFSLALIILAVCARVYHTGFKLYRKTRLEMVSTTSPAVL